MEGMRIEVCMISARGLRKSSSPWKQQWFAVGWIDPNVKYCTKIDNSGTSDPTWNTKFPATISHNSVLTVELYSRDPLFLREKLRGRASAELSEFLTLSIEPQLATLPLKSKNSKSPKPRGFVQISIRFSDYEELEKKKKGDDGSFHRPERSPRHRGTTPPPPPPPPENAGFITSFFPVIGRSPEEMEHGGARSSVAAAMAAGAVIFGEDYLWAGNFRGT